MPKRSHEYREGDQYGCWTVIREEAPERKSWGLQRGVLARCRCGHERVVLPKMLHRNADYCQKCNPGRKSSIVYTPGDQYGPWTIIREVEGRQMPSGWARQILVRCECGEEVVVVRQQLLRSTRCRRCTRSVEVCNGDVFGDLTVIEADMPNVRRTALVRCVCGVKFKINPVHLPSGAVKSCGCRNHRKGTRNPKWRGHGRISGAVWKNYRNGAGRRNLEFKITIEEAWELFLSQEGHCALSGVPIEITAEGDRETTASLDRIDSTQGYFIGNVQWVHKDINIMKGPMVEDRFIEFCSAVTNHRAVASL